jgi:hypothetical protein
MGLMDVVRSAVAVANTLTADLQANVTHEVFQHADGAGTGDYVKVTRPALVTRKQQMVRSSNGEMVLSSAQVVFLDAGVVINEFDRIILPDGTGGPILTTDGFVDSGTGHPISTQVYLG